MTRRLLIFMIVCEMASLGWAINEKPDLRYFGEGTGIDAEGNLYVLTGDYDPNTHGDFLTVKYSKEGKKLWESRFDGPIHGHDTGSVITVDGPGNVHVTGYVQLREIEPNDNYHISAMSFGYATIEYDKKGRQKWVGYYDDPKNELLGPEAIEVDRFGNVYVLGASEVHVPESGRIDDFDKPVHFVTIKYDSQGMQKWAVRYGEPNTAMNRPIDIAVDELGNVYVTGDTHTITLDGSNSYTTIKYDKRGREVWTAKYFHIEREYGSTKSLTVDKTGGVYVLGYCSYSDRKYSDFVTIKYDGTGKQQWMARYREPGNKKVFPVSIVVDAAENVYITGYVDTPGRRLHGYGGNPLPLMVEFVTIKYNARGREQWVAKYKGTERRRGYINGFGLDRKRSVYVKGFIEHPQIRYKQVDIIIKYNEKGGEEWVTYFEDISETAKILRPSYSPAPDKVGIRWFETQRAAKKAALLNDIRKSSDLNAKDKHGYTVLGRAASEGYIDIVKMLIRKGVRVTDGALCAGVLAGQADIVKILAKARGDIRADTPCVFEALTWLEEPAVVKALLEAGLDASAKDKDGDSLLHWPVSYGHTEIVKLLLDAGADANARGSFGEPLVHEALDANDVDIVKAFIEAGVSVNTKNTFGQTLLENAVQEHNTVIVRLLLDAGADANTRSMSGEPLVHEALETNDVDIVKAFIDGGANVETKDEYGKSLLEKAIDWKRQEVAEILRKYGAKE